MIIAKKKSAGAGGAPAPVVNLEASASKGDKKQKPVRASPLAAFQGEEKRHT
jgi:hypothetical protein